MTDLEMTRLCAEAMGLSLVGDDKPYFPGSRPRVFYDPLHDDAQAMALVKKLREDESQTVTLNSWHGSGDKWRVVVDTPKKRYMAFGPDLNRAIVECVAKMQEQKK